MSKVAVWDGTLWRPVGGITGGAGPGPDPDPDPDPDPGGGGGIPTVAQAQAFVQNKSSLPTVGSITTSANGQIIENVHCTGIIRIQHSNVTVRNVYMTFGPTTEGAYWIRTEFSGNVGNILIDRVEIDAPPLNNGIRTIAMNFPGVNAGGITLRRIYVHGVGSGPRFYNNYVVEDSMSLATFYAGSSSHRSGFGNNGGANGTVRRSHVECTGSQSSAAISLYGDNALADNHLLEDNLFVASDGYITYGGSVPSKAFPQGRNVRYLRNRYRFRTPYQGPLYGSMTAFNTNNGCVATGNVWDTAVTLNSGQTFAAGDPI